MLVYMKQLGAETGKHQNRQNQALRMMKTSDNHNGPTQNAANMRISFETDCFSIRLYSLYNIRGRKKREKMRKIGSKRN